MTTLAVALKDEIRRLARKEIKAQIARTTRAVAQYRREISQLKRQQRDQEKKLTLLTAQTRETSASPAAVAIEDLNGDTRFSARSVRAQRRRTGLSAADYAKLVGVSPLTIYNWEHQKSRPRQEQFKALLALRGIGKREAQAKLDLVAGSAKQGAANKPATKRDRPRNAK